jgi:hypothetical protein
MFSSTHTRGAQEGKALTPARRAIFGNKLPNFSHHQAPDNNLISGRWNQQPPVVIFTSAQNIAYLKQEALRRHNLAIQDIELLNYMRQYGVDYWEATLNLDYPETTPQEVLPIVQTMNERTLDGLKRDQYASRQMVGLWRQWQHTGKQVGQLDPVHESTFDKTLETDLTSKWQEYNY